MEKLFQILSEIRPDVDFKSEDKLIDKGVLDSFDIVSIISVINDEYHVNIRVSELGPQNFNSINQIMDMIKRLQGT